MTDRHAVYSAFAGVLPNLPVIDKENCLRFKGENCTKCQESCPFGAVDYEQQDKKVTIEAGAIVVATGFDLFPVKSMPQFDNAGSPEIYDAYQFERIISSTGPTEGKILKRDGTQPESIAFIHCAGSRDKKFKEYCSEICCANTLKMAHLAQKKAAGVKTYQLFSDWCLPGKNYQEFHDKLVHEGTEYIRINNPNDIQVSNNNGKITLNYGNGTIAVDMVVLSSAIVPAQGSDKLAALIGITQDKDKFFSAEHDKISPASSVNRGIYIAGCATGPKDVTQSVLHGQAAAGLALSNIVPGEKLELEVMTAKVDEKMCSACRTCISLCPYQAISYDADKKVASVNEILCKGCGVCVSACPAGAITNKHFDEQEIYAEIEGVLI
jgi:heterodisulfide reductase subunit A